MKSFVFAFGFISMVSAAAVASTASETVRGQVVAVQREFPISAEGCEWRNIQSGLFACSVDHFKSNGTETVINMGGSYTSRKGYIMAEDKDCVVAVYPRAIGIEISTWKKGTGAYTKADALACVKKHLDPLSQSRISATVHMVR